jgi:hypothetical protein
MERKEEIKLKKTSVPLFAEFLFGIGLVIGLGFVDDQSRFKRMNPRARWITPRNVCFSFS